MFDWGAQPGEFISVCQRQRFSWTWPSEKWWIVSTIVGSYTLIHTTRRVICHIIQTTLLLKNQRKSRVTQILTGGGGGGSLFTLKCSYFSGWAWHDWWFIWWNLVFGQPLVVDNSLWEEECEKWHCRCSGKSAAEPPLKLFFGCLQCRTSFLILQCTFK